LDTVFFVAFLVVGVGWMMVFLLGIVGHRSLRDLPRDFGDVSNHGLVSVIIPTRDEGERLERTVRGLLSQVDVDIEVIVIDDRSNDETGQILEKLATESDRLTTIRVETVPDGWLGKCHACHLGSEKARGGWLLFMDADAWIGEDVVARTLDRAASDGADHFCLVPGLGECTLVGKSAVTMITLGLLGIAAGLNRDFRLSYVGVGAFALFRREAYDAVGGHHSVRLEVVEDFALGWLIRQKGLRSRLYAAIPDFEVRWAHSARSFVQVLEKNLFAKLRYSVPRAVANVTLVLLVWALPLIGLVFATPAGFFAAIGMLCATAPAMWMARRHGWSIVPGLLAPLTLPLLAWATARSAWFVLRQGGIRWRETFYPLAELRAHTARIE